MIKTVRDAWQIPELRRKILFTIFALLIFRLGAAIPVPYINTSGLETYLSAQSGTILGLMNAMSGSAFSMATLFALSIQPYINSSIIIQLLTVAIPALERLQKEGGEEGRKKIAAITRYVTVAIGLLQGFGYYTLIRSYDATTPMLDTAGLPGWGAAIVIILCFTAGSAFVMWLGEQITEFGIGNGISIILFAGILSRVPSMVSSMVSGLKAGTLAWWAAVLVVIGILALIVLITWVNGAERRIPVQYAKRVVGRRIMGGQSTYLPIKVNTAGVIPIIFASAILYLPAQLAVFFPGVGWVQAFAGALSSGWINWILNVVLIVFFAYFYTSMVFNPEDTAENLKKQGGFIPGFRPGRPTAEFLSKVLSRLTFFGAIYLGIVAILPIIAENISGIVNISIGGTSVIIVVGVALETVKMIEAQMLMRHYKGFLE